MVAPRARATEEHTDRGAATTSVSGHGALVSQRVQLRPLLPSDFEWVYALMCGPAGSRWRYRGRTPSHEAVSADLWRGVFAQFVVVDRVDGGPCGLVGLYHAAPEAGRAYAFALAEPDRSVRVVEGFGLLCAWGFEHHGLHRIFIETPEFNLEHVASLGAAAVVEGRLRNHDLWQGRFWDLFVLSLTPASFHERFGGLLDRRRDSSGCEHLTRDELVELVASCWPLDSLGLAESLDGLERHVGGPVPVDAVAGIEAVDAGAWVHEAVRRLHALPPMSHTPGVTPKDG